VRSARIELILDTLRAVRGAKDLSKATDDLAGNLDDTARAGDKAGRAVDQAGDDMSQAARAAGKLDREIEQLTGSLREMAIAQALTGDNFSKQIREQETQVRRLTRSRKLLGVEDLLPTPAEMKPAAESFGKTLISDVGKAVTASRGMLIPALVGVAVVASPLIGASVAAAVVGGAGVGGVVGGLFLAARDPRVKQAGQDLGTELLADLEQRASGFVKPALDSIAKVRIAYQGFGGDLDRIFADSAHLVDPLVNGALSGAAKMGHGFADAVSQARPVVDQLGITFDRLGQAGGDFLTKMSKHADDGARALDDLTSATVAFINTTGDIIGDLATLYGWFSKANDAVESFTHGLSIIDMLNPNRPFKELYDGLRSVVGASDDADKSVRRVGSGTFGLADAASSAADAMQIEKDKTKELADQQSLLLMGMDAVKAAQTGLQYSLDSLGGATSLQGQRAIALKQAMDNLYGATIRNVDANETYQASWDSLSGSVKANGRTLNVNTVAGRSNRDALEALLTSNGELYTANIAAGVSVAQATKKHQARTEAVKEEARRLGLNRGETNKLIAAYGHIPPKKTTDLVLRSVDRVADALLDLAAIQLHLAKGTALPGDLSRRLARAQYGMPDTKRAHGGVLPGHAPHDRADNMIYAGTPGEWVIQKPTVRKVLKQYGPAAMDYFNQYGELPEYADGGLLKASKAQWPTGMNYRVTAGMTKVPSLDWVISKAPGGPGATFVRAQDGKPYIWASAGPRGYDCSGIVSAVYNVLHGRNPYSHTFSTGSLPGRWFTKSGIGGPLTAAWSNPGQYPASSSTGHMMGMVGGLTFESSGSRGVHLGATTRRLTDFAHIAHYGRGGHIAMANGGILREPVFGYGTRSGATYSLAERGPERVSPLGTGAGTVTINAPITINGSNLSPQQIAAAVSRELGRQADVYARTG
jgi:hypothetical protein